MEMVAQITLKFNWKIGKVTFNEITYKMDEAVRQIFSRMVEKLVEAYQGEVVNRLRPGHSSSDRRFLGRHLKKGSKTELCKGRTVRRRGFRWSDRGLKSRYGDIWFRLQEVECLSCGRRYAPVLEALKIAPYQRHDEMVEQAVLDAVIDTNYRRLIEGHGIDISVGGVHNYIAGSDLEEMLEPEIDLGRYEGILADGTGVKKHRGKRGELRILTGITAQGRLEPIGSWTDTSWEEIEKQVRRRLSKSPPGISKHKPLLVYDGEPGLENFMADLLKAPQRCTWHGVRGLYHAMWDDEQGKKVSGPYQRKLGTLLAIEIPEEDYDVLSEKAVEQVRSKYEAAKQGLNKLIEDLQEKECPHAVEYLTNLKKDLFHQVELWLATGIIAPKTTSRLERLIRELARRLKNIGWGWSDKIVTKLSKMIMVKKYNPDVWKKFWLKKLGINGNFNIRIEEIAITPCLNF